MIRLQSFAIGTTLMFALTGFAQQATPAAAQTAPAVQQNDGLPNVQDQMKLFTGRLELTADQQDKLKPILDNLNNQLRQIIHDDSLSSDERHDHIWTARYGADKQIRVLLSDDQKQKLDQLEQEPHPELHGNVGGF
jgi:hypothetical protein